MPCVGTTELQRSAMRSGVEKAVLTLALVAFFIAGYFFIGHATDSSRARELTTPLDRWIPFVPASIWVYLWMLPAALIPLFAVRCQDLFRRTYLAYAIAIAISLACFAAFPVTSLRLRVDPAALDVTRFAPWAVATLYALDPPYNLFPSLHLSIATLAAFSAWKADRRYGAATFAGVALVAVSICTVKQHFLLDGIAGMALAALTYAVVLRPYRPAAGVRPGSSWRGIVAYLVMIVLAYTGLYVAFRFRS